MFFGSSPRLRDRVFGCVSLLFLNFLALLRQDAIPKRICKKTRRQPIFLIDSAAYLVKMWQDRKYGTK